MKQPSRTYLINVNFLETANKLSLAKNLMHSQTSNNRFCSWYIAYHFQCKGCILYLIHGRTIMDADDTSVLNVGQDINEFQKKKPQKIQA
jgi:hypothetical protein